MMKHGDYAVISVADTGIGMDESVRNRIFDPFFTTKEKERGTGLGLASAYGIIKNHGGKIVVESEVGEGSTFSIFLPASGKEVYEDLAKPGEVKPGSELVLLIDDEEMILYVGRSMLEKLGYGVIIAGDGITALEAIAQKGSKIDLVILDLIMPGMDGSKVFERIREIQPDVPVILSSGYAISSKADEMMSKGCNGFIQKPFNISELSTKIREVLEGKNR